MSASSDIEILRQKAKTAVLKGDYDEVAANFAFDELPIKQRDDARLRPNRAQRYIETSSRFVRG